MVRIALIGCGSHSRAHHAAPLARYVRAHPGRAELAAACDLDLARAEACCGEFGFARAYADADEMLRRERPDGCVCIMPVARIAEMGSRLLRRHVPCVIEKPLGATREEVRELAGVAEETRTPHMVSVNRRFNPYLNRAIQWCRPRGDLRFVRGLMVRHNRREEDFIWSTAVHGIDALRHVVGEVDRFDLLTLDAPPLSARWYGVALQFRGGCAGRLDIATTAGTKQETYELYGEGFRAEASVEFAETTRVRCWCEDRCELDDAPAAAEPMDAFNGAYHEAVEFIEALAAGRPPGPTVADILPSMEICFDLAGR